MKIINLLSWVEVKHKTISYQSFYVPCDLKLRILFFFQHEFLLFIIFILIKDLMKVNKQRSVLFLLEDERHSIPQRLILYSKEDWSL